MSYARQLSEKVYQFLEVNGSHFTLSRDAPGWKFISNEKTKVPKGTYVTVASDALDEKNRVLVSKKGSFEMYSMLRSDIPTLT